MKITFTWISWYKTVFHALCYWGHYLGITWSEAMIFALDDFVNEERRKQQNERLD